LCHYDLNPVTEPRRGAGVLGRQLSESVSCSQFYS
jgi:hypothetical protein